MSSADDKLIEDYTHLLMETFHSMFPPGAKYFVIVAPEENTSIEGCIGIGNFDKLNSLRVLRGAIEKVEAADESERKAKSQREPG